jgi:hypothetical protein
MSAGALIDPAVMAGLGPAIHVFGTRIKGTRGSGASTRTVPFRAYMRRMDQQYRGRLRAFA